MKSPARDDAHEPAIRRPGFDELDLPDSVWNRAAARTAAADPFCCRTEWQLSAHEAFYPYRPLHLRECGGSVVAFAERRDAELGPLLEPLEASWLFACPLLGDDAVELLDALLGELSRRRPAVLLSGLPRNGALRQRVLATFGARRSILRLESSILCQATLDGGLDGWLGRRSGRLRRNLRAAARRAGDRGVRFERHVPRTDAEAAAVYARMLAVERASWKGIGRCGMAEEPSRGYYDRMLRRLAAGGAGRVVFARRDDDDIGFVFGGLAGRVYRGQQFSYDDDWHAFSIGNLLQVEQVRWLCEEGAERYDMGPLMDYKWHWTETRVEIEALVLQPSRPRA